MVLSQTLCGRHWAGYICMGAWEHGREHGRIAREGAHATVCCSMLVLVRVRREGCPERGRASPPVESALVAVAPPLTVRLTPEREDQLALGFH
jgi:hypothetical protein